MCSVIGFRGKYDEDLLNKIFLYSRIRGLHSFGYSFYNPELTTKKFLSYESFLSSIHNDRPNLFIAHFRYSTSGDYLEPNNNQPLQDKDISIAFNGVISQGTKEDMEETYNVELAGENDGYVLLKKYEEIEFKNSNITYAMVGLKSKKLLALRNKRRPLWYKETEDKIIVCSTKDILVRSGIEEPNEINPLEEYIW
jgi:glutamine phosphoribosylpyrophosphate amidotransferase